MNKHTQDADGYIWLVTEKDGIYKDKIDLS